MWEGHEGGGQKMNNLSGGGLLGVKNGEQEQEQEQGTLPEGLDLVWVIVWISLKCNL
jgi:hypothetical protein